MKGVLKHPLRVTGRLLWLAGELGLAFLDFIINVVFARKVPLTRARALWLQQTCRRVLRALNTEVTTNGSIPTKGLLVSNHLGYVDILVLSAITPAVFISKSSVRRWPIFGWFALLAGTLFVKGTRRSDVSRLNREVTGVLDGGGLVVMFPEGASPDGRHVLSFKSSLLEPVTRHGHPLAAATISYSLSDGDVGEDICYQGDMALLPHLVNLFSKAGIRVAVSFTGLEHAAISRKELARKLHSRVVRLRESVVDSVTE